MAGLNTAQIIERAKTFGKNISSSEADSILKSTFNKSIYGADPSKVDAYFQGGSPASSMSVSSGGGNSQSYVQSAIDQMKKANEPIVQSYQASIPETQKKFSTQREGIKSRYDNLIASIKGNQQVAETRQTTTTNNELGKRGITSSSGVAQQEMTNALNPITQQYTGMQKEAVTAQGEEEGANIAGETDAVRAIQNAIAQLQTGATTQGIQLGTNLYQTDEQSRAQSIAQELQRQQLEEQKRQADLDAAFREKQLAQNQSQFNTTNKSGDISSLFNVLGIGTGTGNTSTTKPQGQYIPAIGKSVIGYDSLGRAIYSDGTRGYTYGKK